MKFFLVYSLSALLIFPCDSQPAYIEAHNNFRRLHGANDLVLDEALEDEAFQYAQYLLQIQKRLVRSKDLGVSDGTQGENLGYLSTESKNNLGVATYDISAQVDVWYSEVTNLDYGSYSSSRPEETITHVTQLLWKSTTKVGCAQASSVEAGTYTVCRYFPSGNVMNSAGRFDFSVISANVEDCDENVAWKCALQKCVPLQARCNGRQFECDMPLLWCERTREGGASVNPEVASMCVADSSDEGCGAYNPPATGSVMIEADRVSNQFSTIAVSINVGQMIEWKGLGDGLNVVQTQNWQSCVKVVGGFTSGSRFNGDGTYSHRFLQAGTFYYASDYHCSQNFMYGVIVVKDIDPATRTLSPTGYPTFAPSRLPTPYPTFLPTQYPTLAPTRMPTVPCVDDSSWSGIGYGKCNSYSSGEINHAYCVADGAMKKCCNACQGQALQPGATAGCIDDSAWIGVGFGGCVTYSAGQPNHYFCSVDGATEFCCKACSQEQSVTSPTMFNPSPTMSPTYPESCVDSLSWPGIGFGGCITYMPGQLNHNYCRQDAGALQNCCQSCANAPQLAGSPTNAVTEAPTQAATGCSVNCPQLTQCAPFKLPTYIPADEELGICCPIVACTQMATPQGASAVVVVVENEFGIQWWSHPDIIVEQNQTVVFRGLGNAFNIVETIGMYCNVKKGGFTSGGSYNGIGEFSLIIQEVGVYFYTSSIQCPETLVIGQITVIPASSPGSNQNAPPTRAPTSEPTPFDCTDDTTWTSPWGNCDTYHPNNNNHQFCEADGATEPCCLACQD